MKIYPTTFTMEHIPKTLSPTGNISSAPKDFAVYVSTTLLTLWKQLSPLHIRETFPLSRGLWFEIISWAALGPILFILLSQHHWNVTLQC
jgi:hypothetical protein